MEDKGDGNDRIEQGALDNSTPAKPLQEELSLKDKVFKDLVLQKLIDIRDKEIQPELYDKNRPERNPFVQRANFIYALIFKIKDEFRKPGDVLNFVTDLEDQYPLAIATIAEVKQMLKLLPKQDDN